LLIIAVGIGGAYRAFAVPHGIKWEQAGRILMLYALLVPTITGLMGGHDVTSIIRDIIAFMFLLLPLFLIGLLQNKTTYIKLLTTLITISGLIFAARVLIPVVFTNESVADPLRLANAPTVLFSALLLIGFSGMHLYRVGTPPYALKAAFYFALSLIPLAAMALITQRASIGAACLTIAVLCIIGLYKRPLRMAIPLALSLAAAIIYWPVLYDLSQGLMRKTSLVGFNMRWQEALVVFESVGGSFFTVMFGKGWGASIASPAVGGDVVTFTHSLITTYWLKTGLIGLFLALLYLYRIGVKLWPLLWHHPVIAMALAGPFLIDIFLYASFKSLDFGLILLLIILWADHYKNNQGKHA